MGTPTIDGCAEFLDDLALLALGTLSGRRRAEVIDHLERCVECATELEGLSVAADALLLLAPEATPPAGFDARAIAAMSAGRERRRFSGRVGALAAAAMLVVGFGVGVLVHDPGGHDQTFASATLTSATGTKGDVILSKGSDPWMFMTLDGVQAHGSVTCTVTLIDGKRVTVGHFDVRSGYGAWAVWLQTPAQQVRSVAVLDQSGVTLASATISA